MDKPSRLSSEPNSRKGRSFGGSLKFRWFGHDFEIRLTTQKHLASLPPELGVQALHLQQQDASQLIFTAMTALARDVYSRDPHGSREFEGLCRLLGLKFSTARDEQVDIASLL